MKTLSHIEFDTHSIGFSLMEQNYQAVITSLLCGLRAGPTADLPRELVCERAVFPKRKPSPEELTRVKGVIKLVLDEISNWSRQYYGKKPLAEPPIPDPKKGAHKLA